MITALPPAHSPLFDAARELLRDDGDESAAVWALHTSWPEMGLAWCSRFIRQAALQLHCAGERP